MPARVRALSDDEVLRRWTQLFTGPLLVQRYLSGVREQMGDAELAKVHAFADLHRQRLLDVSWFCAPGRPARPSLCACAGPGCATRSCG